MYKIKSKIYAEPGCVLEGNGKTGFQFEGELEDFTERIVDISRLNIDNSFIRYDIFKEYLKDKKTYSDWKSYFVKKRYSVEDQIAIILNKDKSEDDRLKFEKMQEWREWSAKIAENIINAINI